MKTDPPMGENKPISVYDLYVFLADQIEKEKKSGIVRPKTLKERKAIEDQYALMSYEFEMKKHRMNQTQRIEALEELIAFR